MSLYALLADPRILVAVLVGGLGLAFLLNANPRSRPYVVWFAASALMFAGVQAIFRALEVAVLVPPDVGAPAGSFVGLLAWAAFVTSLQRLFNPAGIPAQRWFLGSLSGGAAVLALVLLALRPTQFGGPTGIAVLLVLTSAWVLRLWFRDRWHGLLLLAFALLFHPILLSMAVAEAFSVQQFRMLTPGPFALVYVLAATLILHRDAQLLEGELTQRRAAEAQLQVLADGLDGQVRERTRQLEEVVAGLQSFTGMVSHDLRSPLGNMQGLSGLAQDALGKGDAAKAVALLGVLEGEARRAVASVADLLTLARADQGPAVRRPVDFGGLVLDCVEALSREHPRAREIVRPDPLPTVALEGALFHHAVTNLIGNALKFGAERPDLRVEVSASREAAGWRFQVRDNGPGFDPARAGELFRPFARLDPGTTSGTGLGLTVVRRVVERHGGVVGAESAPGAGATFWWTLPDDEMVAPAAVAR